jgi:dihydroneopterin aldolase
MIDQIHLFEAVVPCRIGTTAEERSALQDLVLDVSMRRDLTPAAYTENIGDTIDYVQVLDLIHFVAGAREWVLLESLAEALCGAILRQFPVLSVRLLIRKPAALRDRNVGAPAVEIERFHPENSPDLGEPRQV